MKKTNTINLGGIIFHVDEDAFTQLQNYLNAIRSYFSKSDGQEEIIADIESRIAEIFQEKKISIITIAQVDDVIAIMGKPEDYGDGEHDEKNTEPLVKEKEHGKYFATQMIRFWAVFAAAWVLILMWTLFCFALDSY